MRSALLAVAASIAACGVTRSPAVAMSVEGQIALRQWMFKDCYTAALQFDASAGGKVLVDVRLAPDGSVLDTRALCSSASPLLTTCTVATLRTMHFDASSTASFKVPVVYNAKDDGMPACPEVGAAHSDARADNPDDVVAWNRFRLRQCIDQLAGDNSGTARIRVDVDDAGMGHPKVVCSGLPEPLTSCLVDAFSAMRFAKSAAGKSLVTPVVVPSATGVATDCSK